ncbi:XdhC/CoxI family protein [Oleiagrimonas sp. C23AA]|uniref:XdhC family protein n=1 Tax=Oleiagrimonas sp. C23AA TaxID=2719047 RepID=UPI0014227955|nr:XdhC/CoxI family protein [Oleiagrimonas sp. C23AA]NII09599.1 XdhC/CoxI family protein [Oleiagrimonas sp. C23AA]
MTEARPSPLLEPMPVGGMRGVVEAALRGAPDGCLGVVLATEGSTYRRAGAMIHIASDGHRAGWVSGGCLEPELEALAGEVMQAGRMRLLCIDTRDDGDIVFGSGTGCRGRQWLALLPMRALPKATEQLQAWSDGDLPLHVSVHLDGQVRMRVGQFDSRWSLAVDRHPGLDAQDGAQWQVEVAPPPRLVLFGGGPESTPLLWQLRTLGWHVEAVERRPHWRERVLAADRHVECVPREWPDPVQRLDAALLMHHNFELDREALERLAPLDIAHIGLLGPPRRRDDLLATLDPGLVQRLKPRLQAPVGLILGGRGPEAIALAVAAGLHQWRQHRHGDA